MEESLKLSENVFKVCKSRKHASGFLKRRQGICFLHQGRSLIFQRLRAWHEKIKLNATSSYLHQIFSNMRWDLLANTATVGKNHRLLTMDPSRWRRMWDFGVRHYSCYASRNGQGPNTFWFLVFGLSFRLTLMNEISSDHLWRNFIRSDTAWLSTAILCQYCLRISDDYYGRFSQKWQRGDEKVMTSYSQELKLSHQNTLDKHWSLRYSTARLRREEWGQNILWPCVKL